MDDEVWKDIVGWEGYYQVNNIGEIKSLPRNVYRHSPNGVLFLSRIAEEKTLCPIFNSDGYKSVILYANNKRKQIAVHRIVAITFIPTTEDNVEVNHINGIKTDNRVENLEWITHLANIKHSWETGLSSPSLLGKFGYDHPQSKEIFQISKDGKCINKFGSASEAARSVNRSRCSISRCATNHTKTSGGFIWSYNNDVSI